MKLFSHELLMLLTCILMVSLLTSRTAQAANRKVKICLQPAQSGRCFGYVPSFSYNPYARKCEQFVYGGCGGNENRFKSRVECEKSCRDI